MPKVALIWRTICAGLAAVGLFLSASGPLSASPVQPKVEKLFGQILAARTEAEASAMLGEIRALWKLSGSDTANLLLARVEELAGAGDVPSAAIVADAVVELYPDLAEGWFRRGLIRIARDEAPEASRDLQKALTLEPRHFAALEVLGGLYEAQQDSVNALEAFKRYLSINPHADAVRQKVAALERQSSGSAQPQLPPSVPKPQIPSAPSNQAPKQAPPVPSPSEPPN